MTATSNIFNIKAVMGVIVMEEVVELFSSEGNSSCKGGEVVEMSCSTRWRHPMGLPRAEPTQSRAQVL